MVEDQSSGFMVFWMFEGNPKSQHFPMNQMSQALNFTEMLRKDEKFNYIGMVSENPQSVGKAGVSDKLPADYSWSKSYRAGGAASFKGGIGGQSNGYDERDL